MKRLVYLGLACTLAASLVGCNRSWPGSFCRRNTQVMPESYDCCDPCMETSCYGGGGMTEYLPAAPITTTELPTPGPVEG